MKRLTRIKQVDRELTEEQVIAYNDVIEDYNESMKELSGYVGDPYIEEIINELQGLISELKTDRDEYLASKEEKVITYDIDLERIERIREGVANFKKLVAL